MKIPPVVLVALGVLALAESLAQSPAEKCGAVAPKPLFRDPVYDGAADPIVVWNRRKGRCEGSFVFDWKGRTWIVVATWKTISIYHNTDQLNWTGQTDLLRDASGQGADDGFNDGHPGVVVSADRAFLFNFTHRAPALRA